MSVKAMETALQNLKKDYPIFDINFCIPYWKDQFLYDTEADVTPEMLLTEGLDKIVVSDKNALADELYEANERLLQRVAGNAALYAAPTVIPEMCLGGKNFEEYLQHLIAHKTVIIRMYPKYMRHSMKPWQVGKILRALEAHRIPLMISHTEVDPDVYGELAQTYPNLPIIIEGSDQKTIYNIRYFMGLGEAFKNIYFEMHNFTEYGFIPYALQYIGAEQLLFGTYSPFQDFNGLLKFLDMHTTPEQKTLIFHDNFQRLLHDIQP